VEPVKMAERSPVLPFSSIRIISERATCYAPLNFEFGRELLMIGRQLMVFIFTSFSYLLLHANVFI